MLVSLRFHSFINFFQNIKMKKTLLSIALFAITYGATAQQTVDFESPVLSAADTSWFGQDQIVYGDTSYTIGSVDFQLDYDTVSWGLGYSWNGIAISNHTDAVDASVENQFAALPGEGADGSSQYAVSYNFSGINNKIFFDGEDTVQSIDVTNTVFAAEAIENGSMFSYPFGDTTDGKTGEDWFMLTIYGLDSDSLRTGDSTNFYLADYRADEDSDDYIVQDWQTIPLHYLGVVNGLEFELSSTDSGQFGMNNPSYFAMDNISFDIDTTLYVSEQELNFVSIYPNPTNDEVRFDVSNQNFSAVDIYSLAGMKLRSFNVETGINTISLAEFGKGMYVLNFKGANSSLIERVVVR
jgi:hypothetical protein